MIATVSPRLPPVRLVGIALAGACLHAACAAPAFAQQPSQANDLPLPAAPGAAPPPAAVDPVTGRPVDFTGGRSDVVDQSVAGRFRRVGNQAAETGTVPSFIVLPPMANGDLLAPRIRTSSRADFANQLPGDTVVARKRPEYDPIGMKVGGFTLFPYVSAATSLDTNVFAQSNGRSDVLFTATAGADLRSDWARNQLRFNGFVRQREYAKYTTENAFTYRARATSFLELSRTSSLTTEVTHEKLVVDRSAVDEIISQRRPTSYSYTLGTMEAMTVRGPLELGATARAANFDYRNSETPAGAFISQRFRDFYSVGGGGDIGYRIDSTRTIFTSADLEIRRFDVDSNGIKRDADILTLLAGIRGAVTPLIRGKLSAGYININFKDLTAKTISAITFDTRLDWLVTQRTTINLKAARALRTVAQANSRGSLNTDVQVGVDHEARRNIILSAALRQQWGKFLGDIRRTQATTLNLGSSWLFDRNVQLRSRVSYGKRRDRNFLFEADPKEFGASIELSYKF